MNYELLNKLKEAGFPQTGKGETIGVSGGLIEHSGNVYIPTLSELIEACGERLVTLRNEKEAWRATDETNITTVGKTPEEAVANLWLELNKKND